MAKEFYERRDWLELRYKVLRLYGFKCQACGIGRDSGAVIQVDHIKPISIHPELALSQGNLQVLCKLCNLGKSNKYMDDFRPVVRAKTPRRRYGKKLSEIKAMPDPEREFWLRRRKTTAFEILGLWIKNRIARAEGTPGAARELKRYLDAQRMARAYTAKFADGAA